MCSAVLVLFGARKAGCFREAAALYSAHYSNLVEVHCYVDCLIQINMTLSRHIAGQCCYINTYLSHTAASRICTQLTKANEAEMYCNQAVIDSVIRTYLFKIKDVYVRGRIH